MSIEIGRYTQRANRKERRVKLSMFNRLENGSIRKTFACLVPSS